MGKHDHASCEHDVAWCRHCDVAYCRNCDITWTRRPMLGTTFPWYGGLVQAYPATNQTHPPPGIGVEIPPPCGLTAQDTHAHCGAGDASG